MFRHQGKTRSYKHNLKLAIVLSLVAGIVNVTGFLAISQLTTNVTGHFALFINDLANFEFWKGTVYFLYILSFLLGAFTSGMLIEKFRENKRLNVFVLPTSIEVLLLITVPILVNIKTNISPDIIACLLLFAMGLQNSYVTRMSNAVVRTTHLTGLFTDLGIEISQLFFPKAHPEQDRIRKTIKLRIYIISFFFAGGLLGGYLYSRVDLKMNTLFIAAFILLASLFYDDFRYRLITSRRRFKQRDK